MRRVSITLLALLLGCGTSGPSPAEDSSDQEGSTHHEASGRDKDKDGASGAPGGPRNNSNLQGPEDCGNRVDDDGDAKVDCDDPECAPDPACTGEEGGPGGPDADGKSSQGPENCGDRKDDDGDGLVDCADPDCSSDEACSSDSSKDAAGTHFEDCGNRLDEDKDGKVDCEDSDCAEDPACEEGATKGSKAAEGLEGGRSKEDLDAIPVGVEVGFRSPDFELPYIGRPGTLKLSSLRGQIVIISFWASWCGPCRKEVPALELTWQLYKEREVSVVGISIDEKPRFADDFLGLYPVSYPMVLDKAGADLAAKWKVSSIPVTLLLDRDGVVVERRMGYTPRQLRETVTRIDAMLEG